MPLLQKPKRPHPRSLDALFPIAKIKRCPAGHSQSTIWRPSWGCSTCAKNEAEFARRAAERTFERQHAAERERVTEAAKLPKLPAVIIMRSTKGETQIFRPGPKRRRARA